MEAIATEEARNYLALGSNMVAMLEVFEGTTDSDIPNPDMGRPEALQWHSRKSVLVQVGRIGASYVRAGS